MYTKTVDNSKPEMGWSAVAWNTSEHLKEGAYEVVEKRHRGRCYSYINALFRIHHCLHFSLGIRILHFEKKNSQLFKISLFEKVTSNIYSQSHRKFLSVKEETILSD